MKLLKVEKSFELCAEAGWYGYNIFTESPLDEPFIESLSAFGDLLFMKDLKAPFFRVQGKNFLIKGLLGRDNFRIGIAGNDTALLEEVLQKMEKISKK